MQRRMTSQTILGLLALASFLIPVAGEAAVVSRAKDKQVLVDLERDGEVSEGDRFLVIVDGKRKAIVEITKTKGKKAIGKVLRGSAVVNGKLEALPSKKSATTAKHKRKKSSDGESSFAGTPISDLTLGALVGASMNSQTINAACAATNTTESVAMSGTGFNLKAFGDLPIAGPLGIIGRVGLEQFSVTGESKCRGTEKTSILYATTDLLLRYNFMTGQFVPFAATGLGIHFPLSKSSDILDVQRISSTVIFFFTGGLNYAMNENLYLQGIVEYGLFPPSNDVKTSMISARFGAAMAF